MRILKMTLKNICGQEVGEILADGNYIRDDKTHAVEIEFDNSLKVRREFLNKFDKQKIYRRDTKILGTTKGAPINPFGFCKMAWKERREILMSMIKVDDAEILKNWTRTILIKNNKIRTKNIFLILIRTKNIMSENLKIYRKWR